MAPKRDITLAKAMGKKLTELRRKKYPGHGGQLKCAEDFGVGSGAWSQWERGVRIPSDAYQRELAAFFGISITELRGEAVEQKSPADQAGENKGGATLQGYLAALSNLAGLAAVAADPDNSAWAEHATKVLVALHQGAPGVARAKGKSPRADIQGKNTA